MPYDTHLAPHVFVTRADITHMACDAWLCPTDKTLDVRQRWRESVPGLDHAIRAFDDEQFRAGTRHASALKEWPESEPLPVFTAVPYFGFDEAADLAEIIYDGIAEAARAIGPASRRPSVTNRPLPLIALPLIGSAGGGGADKLGDIIAVVLDAASRASQELNVDVVLVLRSAAQLGLAQRVRRASMDAHWRGLSQVHRDLAGQLAGDAIAGRLVPFMGAGVSMSAGAPSWNQLIDLLADDAHIPGHLRESLKHRSSIDQAEIVMGQFGDAEAFNTAVIRHVNIQRYGLAPTLLAALPLEQAITLNYDGLFEMASRDAGTPCAVIPGPEMADAQRWLLKMHGSVDDVKSIVLTRSDYMGFESQRGVLAALVKASLVTKRLLFVGFGLSDDHFHQILHDVRSLAPTTLAKSAVALTLVDDELDAMAWKDRLDLVAIAPAGARTADAARTLEVVLDLVLALATGADSYLLDPAFASQLSEDEKAMAASLVFARAALAMQPPRDAALRRLQDVIEGMGGAPGKESTGTTEKLGAEHLAPLTDAYLDRVGSLEAKAVAAAGELFRAGSADERDATGAAADPQASDAVQGARFEVQRSAHRVLDFLEGNPPTGPQG